MLPHYLLYLDVDARILRGAQRDSQPRWRPRRRAAGAVRAAAWKRLRRYAVVPNQKFVTNLPERGAGMLRSSVAKNEIPASPRTRQSCSTARTRRTALEP